jgi:hypothetical protein
LLGSTGVELRASSLLGRLEPLHQPPILLLDLHLSHAFSQPNLLASPERQEYALDKKSAETAQCLSSMGHPHPTHNLNNQKYFRFQAFLLLC